METATKNLEDDHVHILKLISVMETIAKKQTPDIDPVRKIVYIIKNFADGLHHAKEENIFFPMLATKGFSAQQGPVAVMLMEHAEGRNFVKGISDNISKYDNGDNSALKAIFTNMLGYAELLRNHISKENNILFRMADKVLSEADQTNLLTRFSSAEKELGRDNTKENFVTDIENLAKIYKV
jgi:hemerythrin-like domain-containing protein